MITKQNQSLGQRLRASRQRANVTREELAVATGLSWAAISQIEAGRRPNPRAETLVAIASALGVTVEYLMGRSFAGRPMLDHNALLYADNDDLLEAVGPALLDGLKNGEAILVVTNSERSDAIKSLLGGTAATVNFAAPEDWYATPRQALGSYRDFATDSLKAGAPWVRVFGEPLWDGRTPEERQAWMRYEALINLVFADQPITLTCLYSRSALESDVVQAAVATHSRYIEGGRSTPNPDQGDIAELFE